MNLSPKAYDRAKWFALVFLPALATFVFAVGGIFDWNYATQAVGVIVSFDTFLGVLLGINNKNYLADGSNFDGDLYISPGEGEQPELHAAWNENPQALKEKGVVTLRTRTVGE